MAPNNHPVGNYFDFTRIQRQSLKLSAIFARNREFKYLPRRLGLLVQRLIFVLIFANCFFVTIMLICTLYMTMHSGFEESVLVISQLIAYTIMPFEMVYFQIRAKTLHDLMEYMNRNFLRRSARGLTYVTTDRSHKLTRLLTIGYVSFANFCSMQYLINPIMSKERVQLLSCWYPFDSLQSPMYEITFAMQTVAQSSIACMFSNSLVFTLGVSLHMCAQFDILLCNLKNLEHTVVLQRGRHMTGADAKRMRRLQSKISADDLASDRVSFPYSYELLDDLSDLPPDGSAQTAQSGQAATAAAALPFTWANSRRMNVVLHGYVRHHQHLLHCAQQLEDIINPVLLCKFVALSLQLCILALNVLRVDHTFSENMSEVLYLVAVVFETFCNAHAGQILLDQSDRVRDFLYTMPWYRMDAALRQDMHVIMMFCSQPLQLTGGKFFIMGYDKFISMIKLSSSFFALLAQEK